MPFADPNHFKDEFGVAGEQVFAYVRPAFALQGHQYALRALPDEIREFPNVVYIVLGQTHPNLLRGAGEAYRLGQNQGAESTLALSLTLAEKQGR